MTYRLLDLFSGIGGFSLGLERSGGFKTVAFCEIEEYPRRVLAKHWPEVPCYDDVRALSAARLAADGIEVDAICGGFPCQDISLAGKGAGLAGERSGLWREYARLIGEIRPRYVIVENVAALLSRGLGDVLADLAALGYDAEWHCIPASAVGAPHRRDRLWAVAYPCDPTGRGRKEREKVWDGKSSVHGAEGADTNAAGDGWAEGSDKSVSNDSPQGCAWKRESGGICPRTPRFNISNALRQRLSASGEKPFGTDGIESWRQFTTGGWWSSEPDVGRVAHGVPKRVDRLKGLGNAVVPQIPELIGRAIMAAEGAR